MDLMTAYGSLMNVGTIIVAIYGAVKVLDGLYDTWKKHSVKDALHTDMAKMKTEIDTRLNDHDSKIAFVNEKLNSDNTRMKEINRDLDMIKSDFIDMQKQRDNEFQIMVKTLLALVSYELDNSNKEDLKKAQQEMLNYLAEK